VWVARMPALQRLRLGGDGVQAVMPDAGVVQGARGHSIHAIAVIHGLRMQAGQAASRVALSAGFCCCTAAAQYAGV
jgi:hypothetical protein